MFAVLFYLTRYRSLLKWNVPSFGDLLESLRYIYVEREKDLIIPLLSVIMYAVHNQYSAQGGSIYKMNRFHVLSLCLTSCLWLKLQFDRASTINKQGVHSAPKGEVLPKSHAFKNGSDQLWWPCCSQNVQQLWLVNKRMRAVGRLMSRNRILAQV